MSNLKKSCSNDSNTKKSSLGTNRIVLPSISSKNELKDSGFSVSPSTSSATDKKPTYLENFTEKDIQDDKADKRCKFLMNKLNELTLNKNDKNKKLQPLEKNVSPRPSSSSSVKSNSSIKNNQKHSPKINRLNGAKSSKSNDISDDDNDESENEGTEIKAPNELLEEVIFLLQINRSLSFKFYYIGKGI